MPNMLEVLKMIRAGKWNQAHEVVQHNNDKLSCLFHAYLHREEGDMGNASYWYRRAGEILPSNSLHEELDRLEKLAG